MEAHFFFCSCSLCKQDFRLEAVGFRSRNVFFLSSATATHVGHAGWHVGRLAVRCRSGAMARLLLVAGGACICLYLAILLRLWASITARRDAPQLDVLAPHQEGQRETAAAAASAAAGRDVPDVSRRPCWRSCA